MILFLRSLLFNLFLLLWTTVLLTLCLPLLMAPAIVSYHIGVLWSTVCFSGLKWICGLSYEVRGRDRLPPSPYLVACKHQSAWDTMVFSLVMRHPSFVMKRKLKHIPLFGWFLARSGMISIDRTAGASALKQIIRDARAMVARNRPVVIFPEGTRIRPGERLPYQPGVFALYRDLGLPLVPIALNSGVFWPKDSFLKHPGRIIMEILPAIPPGLPRKALMERLEKTIEERSAELLEEAGTPRSK
jgi:1-acyl-sn-glycerol-3-phosphate acyltransferase